MRRRFAAAALGAILAAVPYVPGWTQALPPPPPRSRPHLGPRRRRRRKDGFSATNQSISTSRRARPFRKPIVAFVGIWSDAAWTPQLCAALIVENVDRRRHRHDHLRLRADRRRATAGPAACCTAPASIRDGELKFQNSDGSQFAFKPFYADLVGHLATPKGQTYEAIFKTSLLDGLGPRPRRLGRPADG